MKIEIGHRGGIHRVDATSTAIFPNCTPPTGVTRCKSTLFVKKIHRQNPPPNPYFDEYFIFYQAFHVILAFSRVTQLMRKYYGLARALLFSSAFILAKKMIKYTHFTPFLHREPKYF
jgi:hypothetical protein